jgi:hypothetical protein
MIFIILCIQFSAGRYIGCIEGDNSCSSSFGDCLSGDDYICCVKNNYSENFNSVNLNIQGASVVQNDDDKFEIELSLEGDFSFTVPSDLSLTFEFLHVCSLFIKKMIYI